MNYGNNPNIIINNNQTQGFNNNLNNNYNNNRQNNQQFNINTNNMNNGNFNNNILLQNQINTNMHQVNNYNNKPVNSGSNTGDNSNNKITIYTHTNEIQQYIIKNM